MRRVFALLLVLLLAVSSFPLATQTRLICTMTGMVMPPVTERDNPESCCAVRLTAAGTVELTNRSCCTLKTTPGHAALLGALAPEPLHQSAAVLPAATLAVSLPVYQEPLPIVRYATVLSYRGPPPSSTSPRGPPTVS